MKALSSLDSKNTRSRIFLVDDHALVRDGLKRILDEEPDLVVCGEAANAKGALCELETLETDLAIIDISMPGPSGLELIKCLKARQPRLRMMVLSMHEEALYAERALRAGARGYVMKRVPAKELVVAIRAVLRGEVYLSNALSSQFLLTLAGRNGKVSNTLERLSDREIEILRSIGNGFTTRETAASLGISLKTVESHRGNIRQKLKLKTGSELTRFAMSHRSETIPILEPVA